jgi:hypothetical protein
VESELEILSDTMKQVVLKEISPDIKIIKIIFTHLDAIKEVVERNGTLRADFFRDIWKVEQVRKEFDTKEIQLFKDILQEGKEKSVFNIENVEMTATLLHYCIKGIEVPYIRGRIGENLNREMRKKFVTNIVFGALQRNEEL